MCLLQPTLKKQMIAKDVIHSFESSGVVVVYHYNDVNCQEWNRIRNKLAKYEVKLKVIPSKLSSKVTGNFCED